MSWHLDRMVGVDFETTGLDVETDRIVTACVAQVGGGLPVASAGWLADPGVEIPDGASAVHGISTERARAEGTPAAVVVESVVAALAQVVTGGHPLVAMNAAYDLTMLDREARRYGVTPLTDIVGDDLRVVDPLVIDRAVDPYRSGRRNLGALCEHYGVRLDGAHTADADALAACRVVWRLGEVWPQVRGTGLDELHSVQRVWARQQAASLAAHFRRTPGAEHRAGTVRSEWPLVPAPREGGVR